MQDNVFKYTDIASANYGIVPASYKLALDAIAIVGLGGTGSYILDLVAKTWVKSIHLYDGDKIEMRNALRSPGAISSQTLQDEPNKAEYFREVYSKMRENIFAHGYIGKSNIQDLEDMDFVFLAAELGKLRMFVAEKLEEYEVPFIDVGMGVGNSSNTLNGYLRISTSVEESRAFAKSNFPPTVENPDDIYEKQIQVADLNALNAALAVVKWKKIYGFYHDYGKEYESSYLINDNCILNQGPE